jgi:hypothetical protein
MCIYVGLFYCPATNDAELTALRKRLKHAETTLQVTQPEPLDGMQSRLISWRL